MDIEKLIERLRTESLYADKASLEIMDLCMESATALSTLQDENAEMQKQLNEFSEFLCRMTGNLLSKTNYTAQAMIEAAEDYQQRVCDDCDLRAELEQVKQERDAAISDLETIMAYGGGNLDTCQYCKNGQCYARGGTKLCLPQWRGQRKEDDHEVSES